MKRFSDTIFLLVIITSTTVAYRDGARNNSCYGHEVVHVTFGVEATPTECENPCTYTLTVVNKVGSEGSNNIDTYECGETYLLNVNYTRNAFEGFLVQARNSSGAFDRNSSIYGTFLEDSSYLYKPLNCGVNALDVSEVFPNSATQRVPVNEESYVPLYWRAPDPMNVIDELPTTLTFWFTIVQQQQTFFLPIEGPALVRDDASCTIATTPEPTTEEPTTPEPTTEEPTTEEPTTPEPTTEEPTTEEPTTKEPTTKEPTTKEPTTKEPTTEEPTTQRQTTSSTGSVTDQSSTSAVTDQTSTPNTTDNDGGGGGGGGLDSEVRVAVGIGIGIALPLFVVLIILIVVAIILGVKYFGPRSW